MAQAEIRETLAVDKDKFFATVVKYEDYPKFVEGVNRVSVERKGPGHARVKYDLTIMKDITYTLEHKEDAASGRMEWNLVESDAIKRNTGYWSIQPAGPGKVDVTYSVDIEFKIPVPGFILNRLVKSQLPAMLKSFEKQAKG